MEVSRLSIIVPAHNEERRIEPTLRALRAEFPVAELIVVANNCSDRTVEIVRNVFAGDPQGRLIVIPGSVGKGGAVRIGFTAARGEAVGFVDADGSTPPSEVRRLAEALDVYTCAIASRWIDGAQIRTKQRPLRRLLGRGFNLIVRAMFGLRIADTQCGAKFFRREALAGILDRVDTADFSFDVDLLYQVKRSGGSIGEVPTTWDDVDGSTVDVRRAIPTMLASLLRLRIRQSVLRSIVPMVDQVTRLRPVSGHSHLRLLVLSPSEREASDAFALERAVSAALRAPNLAKIHVLWYATGRATMRRPWLCAIAYLRHFRARFDCVMEVVPDGAAYLTPLYSLKPKIVVSPKRPLPRVYSEAVATRDVPVDPDAFAALITASLVRTNSRIMQRADNTWTVIDSVDRGLVRQVELAPSDEPATPHVVRGTYYDMEERFAFICPQGLGDALEVTPAIERLKRARPHATIDLVVLRSQVRDLMAGLSDLVDNVTYLPYWERGAVAFLANTAKLPFAHTYDTAFLAFPAARWEYAALLSVVPARRRIVHEYGTENRIFPHAAFERVDIGVKHNVLRNLDLLDAAGIEQSDAPVRYVVPPSWRGDGSINERRIIFHVGSIAHDGFEAKRWPEAYFAALGRTVQAAGYDVTLVAGPAELDASERVARDIPGARVFTGTLVETARLIAGSRAVVANDNGIAHVAAGVRTPVLALFGPTPIEFAPYGDNVTAFRPSQCPACFWITMTGIRCVRNIEVACLKRDLLPDAAAAELSALLARTGGHIAVAVAG